VNTKTMMMGAALAGLVAGATAIPSTAHAEDVKCYGVNKCKGTGECQGKGHECGGHNACKGKGWIELDKEKCLKIQGGSLEPVEE
jgi:uncharacterized membrane protein